MVTLTALLAVSSVADAKPATYNKCTVGGTSYYSTSAACNCMRAKETSTTWVTGVDFALKPNDRPLGTCFDNASWSSGFTGASPSSEAVITKDIIARADGMAKDNDWFYSPGGFYGPTYYPASIIHMDEGCTIGGCVEVPDDGFLDFDIMGPEVYIYDSNGNIIGYLMTDVQPDSILFADRNDDQQNDMVITFENGTIWNVDGPFEPYEMITPPQD